MVYARFALFQCERLGMQEIGDAEVSPFWLLLSQWFNLSNWQNPCTKKKHRFWPQMFASEGDQTGTWTPKVGKASQQDYSCMYCWGRNISLWKKGPGALPMIRYLTDLLVFESRKDSAQGSGSSASGSPSGVQRS